MTSVSRLKHVVLFPNQGLYNPAIVEYGNDLVGLVSKRWDFNNNLNFWGSIYLFKINGCNFEVKEFREIETVSGLKDYTVFKDNGKLCALIYYRNRIYIYHITENMEHRLLKTEKINSSFHTPFSNKNFSPIETEEEVKDFIYSLNPFRLVRLENSEFKFLDIYFDNNILPSFIPHGGTRFIKFNSEEYLSLFHTYENAPDKFYKVYLITLSSEYPYIPRRISSKPILDGSIVNNLVCDKGSRWLGENAKVVFERGIAKLKDRYIISYGVQDKESRLLIASYNRLDNFLDKKVIIKGGNRK